MSSAANYPNKTSCADQLSSLRTVFTGQKKPELANLSEKKFIKIR